MRLNGRPVHPEIGQNLLGFGLENVPPDHVGGRHGESGAAAVASAAAAALHRLAILRKNVQDGEENVTRFFTLAVGRVPVPKPAKGLRSLVHLVIGNRPGALLHVLAPFDASEINLTFIQSRPLPGRPWEYGFFIEAATDWRSPSARAAWQLVRALSESARQIGTYPVA